MMPTFKMLGSIHFFFKIVEANKTRYNLCLGKLIFCWDVWSGKKPRFLPASWQNTKHGECHAQTAPIKLSFPSCKTALGTQTSRKHICFLSICISIYSDSGLPNLWDKRKNKHALNCFLGPPYSVLSTGGFLFLNQLAVPTWASCL